MPGPVASTRDWQVRISRNGGFRSPKGWRWPPKLSERAALLRGPWELSLDGCFADIGFAASREELRWARAFVAKAEDAEWCYSLTLFDARAVAGIFMPTAIVGGADSRDPRPLRRDERRWRHDWQLLISGSQREGAVLTPEAIERGGYPPVPNSWASYEVAWGFYASLPRAALLWGLDLAATPYRAGDSPRERGALAHALWAATMSQWAVNVAGELLAEARQAWRGQESGDSGRLWWLPGALVRGMRDIGEDALCGGDDIQGRQLSSLLEAIGRVRWSKVDPCWVRRPQENRVGAPIFKGGDFVPWDPITWTLAVRPELVFPPGFCPGPWGIEDRGEVLTGRLSRYRQVGNGLAVCPGGWGAFPYSTIRMTPEAGGSHGRRGAGKTGSFPAGSDTAQGEVRQEIDEPVVCDEGLVSGPADQDEVMCPCPTGSPAEPDNTESHTPGQDEPMSPLGGPEERAGKPVVVMEEVGSDGEGILPSAWNQTQFVRKEECVPVETSGVEDHLWVPFVDESLLGAVLGSSACEERLQRLSFSPVSDESLEALMDLVREIKEIYEKASCSRDLG